MQHDPGHAVYLLLWPSGQRQQESRDQTTRPQMAHQGLLAIAMYILSTLKVQHHSKPSFGLDKRAATGCKRAIQPWRNML